MPDLDGRTYVVTGGNTGIGRATAAGLASRGAQVYLACRSAGKGQAAAADITAATGNPAVGVLPLDLARLDSVHGCAAAFRALGQPLHGLINNAGLAGRRGGQTADGFELAFGVDHLGHFALTTALQDCLTASAPARVVTVSSDAHYQARGIDFDAVRRPGRSVTGLPEYAVAKLCNVLFAQELARRLAGTEVTSYVLHPGLVASDIWRRVPWPVRPLVTRRMLSTEQGARTVLFCATDPGIAAASGRYYQDCQEREPSPVASADLAAELWQRSVAWTARPAGR
ncbi:MAG TPA: SDR family oxidoreductase [Streptosporangiaceae bacterium]|jgi:NAD(P)-dependent dehydrogenase (short-subunit alcohol dehydrogenase family)